MFQIDDTWYHRPPNVPEHLAAGGIIVRRAGGDKIEVAGVREGDASGYILPKGKVEPGESLEVAARREIEEESGLRHLVLLDDLGVRERLDFAKRNWKKTRYFLFLAEGAAGPPTDPNHDYELVWLDLDGALPFFWPEQRELIESNRARIRALLAAG